MVTDVAIVGVPTDFGVDRRGVDMGPSAIRYAELESRLARADVAPVDTGDVDVSAPGQQHHWTSIRGMWDVLAQRIAEQRRSGAIPLVLGGDHSISIGTLRGLADAGSIGILWFDAHGDFNTPETSTTGNVHGMPLALATGTGAFSTDAVAQALTVRPDRTALVGVRSLDDPEATALRNSPVSAFTMADIDEAGMAAVVREAIDHISRDVDVVLVSLDLDVLDPIEAPGVGTPVRGGITYREAHLAMELVGTNLTEAGLLGAMELVEVNPIRDRLNETGELAAELAASAFGDRII